MHRYNPGVHSQYVQCFENPIHVRCEYGVLNFTFRALANISCCQQQDLMINKCFDLFKKKFNPPIIMCYLVISWLASSVIQEFPSVHDHKCLSVPTKVSSLSPQAGIWRLDWSRIRWPMNFQCRWVIGGNFCDIQQHVVSCSGSKQYLYTWSTPSPHWHACLSHFQFYPRYHMLLSTSWCNLAT